MFEVFADYHTHTLHSHGKGTVEENILAAKARGLEEVAITDHGPAALPWIRANLDDFLEIKKEVRDHSQDIGGIRALVGVECNVISSDGRLDVPRQILQQMDVVLAGLHPIAPPRTFRDRWKMYGQNFLGRYSRRMARKARTDNTKAVVEAVHSYEIDIITHPGYQLAINTAELARACAKRGTAMEINAGHDHMTVEYCRVAAREGVKFALSSDAHRPGEVGKLDHAVALAVQAGLSADQIINARPLGAREEKSDIWRKWTPKNLGGEEQALFH